MNICPMCKKMPGDSRELILIVLRYNHIDINNFDRPVCVNCLQAHEGLVNLGIIRNGIEEEVKDGMCNLCGCASLDLIGSEGNIKLGGLYMCNQCHVTVHSLYRRGYGIVKKINLESLDKG